MFCLMIKRPPGSTRTDTLFPYTSLFRSVEPAELRARRTGDEGPDLFGDAAPVRRGPDLTEDRVEAEVDALEDDERGRHVGGLHDRGVRSAGVEEAPHRLRRVLGRHRRDLVLQGELVEVAEVVHDLRVREGGAGLEHRSEEHTS